MQPAIVLCLLMLGFVVPCRGRPKEKRFFLNDMPLIIHKAKSISQIAMDNIRLIYNKATETVVDNVDIDAVLRVLETLLTANTTHKGCVKICIAAGRGLDKVGVLDIPEVAEEVCPSLCEAALDRFAKQAANSRQPRMTPEEIR